MRLLAGEESEPVASIKNRMILLESAEGLIDDALEQGVAAFEEPVVLLCRLGSSHRSMRYRKTSSAAGASGIGVSLLGFMSATTATSPSSISLQSLKTFSPKGPDES